MSRKSEGLKSWRRKYKEIIVEAMGGKCCICGYNKCLASLAFHHLDPTQKDFSFNRITISSKNWNKVTEELRKCILICHNCHNEIHYGITLPINIVSFNESYSDFNLIKNLNDILDACQVCGKLKNKGQLNCSYECAAKNRSKANNKIEWNSVNLQEELKTKSIAVLADELGCSDGAIKKHIKMLENGARKYTTSNSSVIKKCLNCQQDVVVYHCKPVKNSFCSVKCKSEYSNVYWPSNEELLKLHKDLSIAQISKMLNKSKSVIYSRLAKIKNSYNKI